MIRINMLMKCWQDSVLLTQNFTAKQEKREELLHALKKSKTEKLELSAEEVPAIFRFSPVTSDKVF